MVGEIEDIKAVISASDLSVYRDNDTLINIAFQYAVSEVNSRRGYIPEHEGEYEPRFRMNVIQGAVDYLSKLGGGEISSTAENGISVHFREIPSWLQSVTPKLGRT